MDVNATTARRMSAPPTRGQSAQLGLLIPSRKFSSGDDAADAQIRPPGRGHLVDHDGAAGPVATTLLDHRLHGRRLAARLNPVVDQEQPVPGAHCPPLQTKFLASAPVVGSATPGHLLPREDSLALAYRDKANSELDGHRRAEQKAPRLDAAHGRDAVIPERPSQAADHRGESLGVAKDLPDVGVPTDPPEVFEGQGARETL